jgi:hypothetical protein
VNECRWGKLVSYVQDRGTPGFMFDNHIPMSGYTLPGYGQQLTEKIQNSQEA